MNVAGKVVGPSKRTRKPWLSREADNIISLKRAAVNRGDKPERNRLKRAFRAKALEDREHYYNEIANGAEAALQRNDMKPIYKAVKQISGKQSAGQSLFPRKLDGSTCKSEEEALLRWTEYYSQALNHPPPQPCPDFDRLAAGAVDDPRVSIDAPTLQEVLAAITKLNNGRSPGSDGITAEVLKYSKLTSAPLLESTINSYIK